MEAAIDWILTNQKFLKPCLVLLYNVISALRNGVALRWCPYDVTHGTHMTSLKHQGGLHVVLREWYNNAHNFSYKNQICLEQFYMGFYCHLPP